MRNAVLYVEIMMACSVTYMLPFVYYNVSEIDLQLINFSDLLINYQSTYTTQSITSHI